MIVTGIESEAGLALTRNVVLGEAGDIAPALTLRSSETEAALAWDGAKFKGEKGSGVAVRYTKSTGAFSGLLKVAETTASGKTKTRSIAFKGVFVDGTGYGTTTTKKHAGMPVAIEAK